MEGNTSIGNTQGEIWCFIRGQHSPATPNLGTGLGTHRLRKDGRRFCTWHDDVHSCMRLRNLVVRVDPWTVRILSRTLVNGLPTKATQTPHLSGTGCLRSNPHRPKRLHPLAERPQRPWPPCRSKPPSRGCKAAASAERPLWAPSSGHVLVLEGAPQPCFVVLFFQRRSNSKTTILGSPKKGHTQMGVVAFCSPAKSLTLVV